MVGEKFQKTGRFRLNFHHKPQALQVVVLAIEGIIAFSRLRSGHYLFTIVHLGVQEYRMVIPTWYFYDFFDKFTKNVDCKA